MKYYEKEAKEPAVIAPKPNNTIFLEDIVVEHLIEFYKREFLPQPIAHPVPDSEDHTSD